MESEIHIGLSRTTHIIASNLRDVKVRQLKGSETIVKPDWIVACIEQGRLLDFAPGEQLFVGRICRR